MSVTRGLYGLNEDILSHVLEQVVALTGRSTYESGVALKSLSSTCKCMRSYCMSILFHDCRVTGRHAILPETIRAHVRRLHYVHLFYPVDELIACGHFRAQPVILGLGAPAPPPPFGDELDYLPAVCAVTFRTASGGVPWSAIMKCMAHPTITSISLGEDAMWRCAPLANPSDPVLLACRLTHFSYTPPQWREVEGRALGLDLGPTYAQESSYLHALVLAMSATAESLALPVETAPLTEMAKLDWPRLHSLTLVGRYTHPDQCRAIPLLLHRAPNLCSLSVKVTQQGNMRRPLLLNSPSDTSYRLRSLTVAYPDPNDPLFSCIGDGLTSLSLCDRPRHYFSSRYTTPTLRLPTTVFPILTASECLAILQRISAPRLSTLELVYEADDAEDKLLQHLTHAFPLLEELELHRYRASPADDVPYLHIAKALKAIRYLRALFLNVDITDDAFSAWKSGRKRREQVRMRRSERGCELARLFETSEYFEYVALPVHGLAAGMWVLYRPSWSPEGRIEYDSTYALDSPAFYDRWPCR